MLICPHCGKEIVPQCTPLTQELFDYTLKIVPTSNYCWETRALIYETLQLTKNVSSEEAFQFLWRLREYREEEIRFALMRFFNLHYDKMGYEWQWAAGMVKRESTYRRAMEKKKILSLPKEFK